MLSRSTIKIQVLNRISDVPRTEWNALLPARGTTEYHPFTDWDFLNALEVSGSVGKNTGWQAAHIWLKGGAGCVPLYVKSHSMGEYVFDQGWADAAQRADMDYYPKLQCAVPFTPVTGPRLIADTPEAETVLIDTLKDICQQNNMSGVHLTFGDKDLVERLSEQGFLSRTDRQFHFINRDYKDFGDFLTSLTSRKRKKIKAERRKAKEGLGEQGTIKRLRGDDIKPEHWDAFYEFYLDTSARKWGRPYLTRAFFASLHETMREQVLLVLAYQDDTPIAGALNFIGGDALYGRHWGAMVNIPFLHFELCYYQAIEAAIDMGLARVEAGAQGDHKLARGYEPVATYSAHYLTHPGLKDAVANFLTHERRAVARHIDVLGEHTPFKRGK